MKRRTFVIGIILSLMSSTFLFLNVWQSLRFNQSVKRVKELELEQKRLLELNKRLTAGTAVLSSPGRIDELAKNELGLEKTAPSDIFQIELPRGDL